MAQLDEEDLSQLYEALGHEDDGAEEEEAVMLQALAEVDEEGETSGHADGSSGTPVLAGGLGSVGGSMDFPAPLINTDLPSPSLKFPSSEPISFPVLDARSEKLIHCSTRLFFYLLPLSS